MPSVGDGGHGRGEQLLARDHRQVDELAQIATHEHEQRAETRVHRLADQLEAALRARRHDRGRAMAERRGDRALGARLDLEQLQRELLAALGQCAGGRRDAFTLGERLLERDEPLARHGHASLEVFALAQCGACGGVRLVGGATELGGRRAGRDLARLDELELQLGEQSLRGLLADTDALCGAAQRQQRVAASARQHSLGLGAACEHVVELDLQLRLRPALDRADARPPLLGLDLEPGTLAGGALRVGRRLACGRLELDRGRRVVRACSLELGADRGRQRAADSRRSCSRSPPLRSR